MTSAAAGDAARTAELSQLHARGWALVRLRPRTKQAFERGWNTLSRMPVDFLEDENVGVRFGPDSGNLVDIDLDIAQARQLVGHPVFALAHLPEFGRESLQAGQRGHRLLVCPDSPGRSRVYGFRTDEEKQLLRAVGVERLTVLELRASGQTAFPPSIVTREVGDRTVADRLVWSHPEGAEVEIPEMSWEDVQWRAGRLALAAFTAALITSTGDADEQIRDAFSSLLVESGVDDVEALRRMLDAVAEQATPAEISPLEVPASLLAPDSATGVTVRRWLGLETEYLEASPVRPDRGPISVEDLETLLDVLDPCDFSSYFAWRDMMFACHSATGGSTAGREVFVAWCASNPEFYGEDWSRQVRGAWRRCSAGRAGGITLASLLKQVDQAGEAALRHEVMDKYLAVDQRDIDEHPLDSYERIANAPIIPFGDDKFNAPIFESQES